MKKGWILGAIVILLVILLIFNWTPILVIILKMQILVLTNPIYAALIAIAAVLGLAIFMGLKKRKKAELN